MVQLDCTLAIVCVRERFPHSHKGPALHKPNKVVHGVELLESPGLSGPIVAFVPTACQVGGSAGRTRPGLAFKFRCR